MIFDVPPPPGAKGERREVDKKVVDLVRARQELRGSSRLRFDDDAYPISREQWRMLLCANGRVYIEVMRDGKVAAQIDLDPAAIKLLGQDLSRMHVAQRKYHERLRGAHLWIARPHPTKEGWLLVKHGDAEAPFRPVKVGATRRRTTPNGHTYQRNMPTCDGCRKPFVAGERAFEAENNERGWRPLGSARICVGCTQPPREGLAEIEGGA